MGVSVRSSPPLLAGLNKEKRAPTTSASSARFPVNVYVNENFAVSFRRWFGLMRLVEDAAAHGLALTEFVSLRPARRGRGPGRGGGVGAMTLGRAARRLLTEPNAGGTSVLSEALSCEMMERCFGARLVKTEMEVEYFPEGGSITDYTCTVRGLSLAVSVTRAMKFHGEFELEDAEVLLMKKLRGVVQSSHNTLEQWSKQILHVWCINEKAAESMIRAYEVVPSELKSNTLVLLTVATNVPEIFINPKKRR